MACERLFLFKKELPSEVDRAEFSFINLVLRLSDLGVPLNETDSYGQ